MTGLLAPPGTGRLGLRLTPDRNGRAALAVYRPLTAKGRLLRSMVALSTRLPRRIEPADPILAQLAALLGVREFGACVMDSSMEGRRVIGIATEGRMVAVAKVGMAGDRPLRQEAQSLVDAAAIPGVSAPRVLAVSELDGFFVCVTESVHGRPSRSADHAVAVCLALARAGWTHGDLAPWNLLERPATLLDWERAERELRPMHDLSHFVMQSAALLGGAGVARTIALLCGDRGPGADYLAGLGIPLSAAPGLVADYLARVDGIAGSAAERRFRTDVGTALLCAS